MLSPHFTIHPNGFVPSFSVNLFYKKVLSPQQYSWQEPRLNQGILGYAEKMEREEGNGWVISVPAMSSLPFLVFWAWWGWCDVTKDGISSVLSSISPRVSLKTKHLSASEVVFTSGTALARLQWAWEPQFRIWLPKVVLSADLGERPAHFLAPFNFQHMFASLCSSPSHGGWQF